MNINVSFGVYDVPGGQLTNEDIIRFVNDLW